MQYVLRLSIGVMSRWNVVAAIVDLFRASEAGVQRQGQRRETSDGSLGCVAVQHDQGLTANGYEIRDLQIHESWVNWTKHLEYNLRLVDAKPALLEQAKAWLQWMPHKLSIRTAIWRNTET
jgi:hypothetical protein